MDNILQTVQMFCQYASIKINPKKRQAYYKHDRYAYNEQYPENIMVEGKELKYIKVDEAIKYLSVPIGAMRSAKLNFSK
jgi:hypothetical protein